MALRIKSGAVTVTLDDGLTRLVERAIRNANGVVIEAIEDQVQPIHADAVAGAPVKSGRFKKGLAWALELDPSSSEIRGKIDSSAPYTHFIKTPIKEGSESVFRDLVVRPMRRGGRQLVRDLGPQIAQAWREGT